MNVLVVPTIREKSIQDFLHSWRNEHWDKIIIVEDNPRKTFDIDVEHHYSWEEIDADLEENSWIISRRDSAIRSYGFLVAYRLGAEIIFSLDDDCYPVNSDFCKTHVSKLEKSQKWTESVLGMKTRGIPYRQTGILENVVLNMGLWRGVPDLDAVQSLHEDVPTDFEPPTNDRIIPAGQYFPLCGMNFAFKRELTVLGYFAPMGDSKPYRRFDDIWYGIILKKICDHLGWHINCGNPIVHHKRASDPFVNLVKEATGIKANEQFWQTIDNIPLLEDTPKTCLIQIARNLQQQSDTYLREYGGALEIWAGYFDDLGV